MSNRYANRDKIRLANPALISGRQMLIRAGTLSIFLVAITENEWQILDLRSFCHSFIGYFTLNFSEKSRMDFYNLLFL